MSKSILGLFAAAQARVENKLREHHVLPSLHAPYQSVRDTFEKDDLFTELAQADTVADWSRAHPKQGRSPV